MANEAKAGKFGVEAQADELIAQIALAEQGGALSLYEAALAALRTGDNGRARALLTEVAAAGDSLDESMRAKVENLLQKLMHDDKGKPDGKSSTHAPRMPRHSQPRNSTPRSGPRSPRAAACTKPIRTRRSRSTRRPCRPCRPPGFRPT